MINASCSEGVNVEAHIAHIHVLAFVFMHSRKGTTTGQHLEILSYYVSLHFAFFSLLCCCCNKCCIGWPLVEYIYSQCHSFDLFLRCCVGNCLYILNSLHTICTLFFNIHLSLETTKKTEKKIYIQVLNKHYFQLCNQRAPIQSENFHFHMFLQIFWSNVYINI